MHDGGINMNLFINNNLTCNSTMFYERGATPAMSGSMSSGMGPKSGHSRVRRNPSPQEHSHASSFGGDHIDKPGACTDFGEIKRGDLMSADAVYDMTQHTAMTHEGKPERLMGNMRVYMGPE
jgi:hypothetical protein